MNFLNDKALDKDGGELIRIKNKNLKYRLYIGPSFVAEYNNEGQALGVKQTINEALFSAAVSKDTIITRYHFSCEYGAVRLFENVFKCDEANTIITRELLLKAGKKADKFLAAIEGRAAENIQALMSDYFTALTKRA